MAVIGRSNISAQYVNPVADFFIHTLYDFSLFAPQFFDSNQTPIMPQEIRPVITDVSKFIKRAYTKGETIKVPGLPVFVSLDKAEGTEVTDQTATVFTQSVTITNHKYVSVLIEDASEPFINLSNFENQIAQQAMKAIAQTYDDTVIAVLNTFTNSLGGGVGDTLDFSDFAKVNKYFFDRGINIDAQAAWAALNSDQYAYIAGTRDEYLQVGKENPGNTVKFIETPHGLRVTRSHRIPSSGGVSLGAAFTEEAMMCAFAILPRTLKERDTRKVGYRHYFDCIYGVAKMRDVAGVKLAYNATPTV